MKKEKLVQYSKHSGFSEALEETQLKGHDIGWLISRVKLVIYKLHRNNFMVAPIPLHL